MIIGIEGVSCVGKTTLSAALATRMSAPAVIPCYYHASPDPSRLPSPEPFTFGHQLSSIAQLLDIEDLRVARAKEATLAGREVILDRTVDTLLAHAHAVGRMNDFDCDEAARHLVTTRHVAMPDLTIFLTSDPDVVERRASLRDNMPTIFYDRHFSQHFNTYFTQPLSPTVVHLDTTDTSIGDLTARALSYIERHRATAGRHLRDSGTQPVQDAS